MIQTISSTLASGELLELNIKGVNNLAPLLIVTAEGIGAPNAIINSVGSPNLHGAAVNSAKANQRYVTLTILVQGTDAVGDAARTDLYKYFPISKKITLGVLSDARDVEIDMFVEENPMKMFNKQENTEVKLTSESPWFRAKTATLVRFSGTTPLFQFPFSNPVGSSEILFGEELSYIAKDIIYEGDVETGVLIDLHIIGVVTGDIVVYNPGYGQSIAIDCSVLETVLGSPLQSGDKISINTVVGEKNVSVQRNGVSYDVLHAIGRHPEWITLYPGSNSIVYDATEGADKIQLSMSYFPLYQGVI